MPTGKRRGLEIFGTPVNHFGFSFFLGTPFLFGACLKEFNSSEDVKKAQASERALSTSSAASMAGMFGGMNQTLFGLDPEMQTSMDPKLLQAAGIDPKMLSSLNPKMLK